MRFCVFFGSIFVLFTNLYSAEFKKITQNNDENFKFVEQYFSSVIEPLYGNQSQALEKIKSGKDRTCELLFDEEQKPIGILVYKHLPTDEFSSLGAPNALEIKTLFVINADKNSGKGIGSQLLGKVLNVAKQLQCSHLVVTVSEDKQESLAFFQRKNFFVTHTMHGKFKKEKDEYVLVQAL